MLIDTDAVQVHYERAENIVGSSTKMTVRRTEYLACVDIGNSLVTITASPRKLHIIRTIPNVASMEFVLVHHKTQQDS
jgi:hypothetical protein